MTLHIFNPDTDYALAADRRYYTPPAQVVAVRRQLALLPATYAGKGDYILLLDKPDRPIESLPYYAEVLQKQIEIIGVETLKNKPQEFSDVSLRPWGWNRSIRQFLLDAIGKHRSIPSELQVNHLRELSHRRTTIAFHNELSDIVDNEIQPPVELCSVEEAMAAYNSSRNLFFKAPWSSSGRGILLTDDLEPRHVEPWLQGIISRQGSVMMEKAYPKVLDFATEWLIENGSARFLGYSVFKASRRGKYHSNINRPQEQLRDLILKTTDNNWSNMWLERLQAAIERIIGDKYVGPIGIDMLVTESGNINPCVEVNLRHTMGMVYLI